MSERLGRHPSEVRRARALVRAALRRSGLERLLSPVELAVSELVTNALRHGRGEVGLTAAVQDDELRVEVADEGGGRPVVRAAGPTPFDPGGWGLQFVEQLADRWGSQIEEGHTRVWFTRRL